MTFLEYLIQTMPFKAVLTETQTPSQEYLCWETLCVELETLLQFPKIREQNSTSL